MGGLLTETHFYVDAFGCKFVVYGKAQPGGSKKTLPRWRKWPLLVTSAKHLLSLVNVTDDNARAKPWQQEIAIVAGTLMKSRQPYLGPLAIWVDFYSSRPQWHTNKKGLVASAPRFPEKRPDATKLLRPVEDALTGILWGDDGQVVEQHVRKLYGEPARMVFKLAVRL